MQRRMTMGVAYKLLLVVVAMLPWCVTADLVSRPPAFEPRLPFELWREIRHSLPIEQPVRVGPIVVGAVLFWLFLGCVIFIRKKSKSWQFVTHFWGIPIVLLGASVFCLYLGTWDWFVAYGKELCFPMTVYDGFGERKYVVRVSEPLDTDSKEQRLRDYEEWKKYCSDYERRKQDYEEHWRDEERDERRRWYELQGRERDGKVL